MLSDFGDQLLFTFIKFDDDFNEHKTITKRVIDDNNIAKFCEMLAEIDWNMHLHDSINILIIALTVSLYV